MSNRKDFLRNREACNHVSSSLRIDRRLRGIALRFELLEPRCLLSASSSNISSALGIGVSSKLSAGIERPGYRLSAANGLSPQSSSSPVGLTPAQIRHAYGFDQITFAGGIVGDGTGQTIAIVDAYDAPTIQSDLHTFDVAFKLPDPPSFTRVAQDGTTNYPSTDPAGSAGAGDDTWEIETALDVEWAHALAPGANILLVEASSASDANLIQAAVNYARSQPGVVAVSMSFSGTEFSGETSYDTYFTTPNGHDGVTFLAATGDSGQPSGYPAYSPNVLAVGGTTLSLADSAGTYSSETGWSGSGGGVSTVESQPSFQSGIVTQSSTKRANPDVAFDADPNSGVAIYDSYDFGSSGWIQVGGTSFATPAWAGLIAVADQGRKLLGLGTLDGKTQTLPALYQLPSADFHDITGGNNGFGAAAGYDLVTGLGSPRANLVVNGLLGSSISGTVFSDLNSNGVQDNGEPGLAGWTVFDDLNNNGVLDTSVESKLDSTQVPVTIPDRRTITSTITVTGLGGSISDLNLNLNVSHTYDSDLVMTLFSPSGTSITLASHNGGSGDNFTNTTFDDQAATSISSGSAPFTGSFRPIGSLSAFNGQTANGVWTLQISDTVPLDSGVLNAWSLDLTTGAEPSVVSDSNGNYCFINLTTGTHHIREVPQGNFVETVPASGVYDVAVTPGANISNQNFGDGPVQKTVTPPPKGDFNGDGSLDTPDIFAMMMALANYQSYASMYQNPIAQDQLVAMGDVSGDGAFNNGDIQALIAAVANAIASSNTSGAAAPASTVASPATIGVAIENAIPSAQAASNNVSAVPIQSLAKSEQGGKDNPETSFSFAGNNFIVDADIPAAKFDRHLQVSMVHAAASDTRSNSLSRNSVQNDELSSDGTALLRRHLRWSQHRSSVDALDSILARWDTSAES